MGAEIFPIQWGSMSGNNPESGARALTPEARRALEEAEQRRQSQVTDAALPAETGGRKGPDPARYGDWEKDGIVSDF